MAQEFVLWAGSQSAWDMVVAAVQRCEARLSAGIQADQQGDTPYLLSNMDGVGVISIKGPMTNTDSPWNRWDGVVSYNDIRAALVAAANDPDISRIVLDINSGGGAVNGVADVASLIQNIDASVKPVTAFTDGSMCSAAYWLGSSARQVYASKVATVGSVGVLATLMERSKMLKEMGINAKVMRAGKFKALANGIEPLTAEAEAQVQESLDAAYQVFVQHVAEARNVSYDTADQNMAQGREFFGQQALAAGLADGLATFDTLLSMEQQKIIDQKNKDHHNQSYSVQGNHMTQRTALTEQQIAALAEGAPLAAAGITAPMGEVVTEPAAQASTEAAATVTEPAAPEAQAAAPVVAPAPQPDAVVKYLEAQVQAKDSALATAQAQVTALTTELAGFKATHGPLLDIARASTTKMVVALGGSGIDITGFSAERVLAEHAAISSQFAAKFKVGAVAAQATGETTEIDMVTRRRLQATTAAFAGKRKA